MLGSITVVLSFLLIMPIHGEQCGIYEGDNVEFMNVNKACSLVFQLMNSRLASMVNLSKLSFRNWSTTWPESSRNFIME